MENTKENALREQCVDTTEIYTAMNSAQRTIKQRAQRWLCWVLCPGEFFNADASLEIDRLRVEIESLREQLTAAKAE